MPSLNSETFKNIKLKYVIAALVLILLILGVAVGMYLTTRSQEVRQQASTGYNCAGGIQDGALACSGFREVVRCMPTGLVHVDSCDDTEQCQNGTGCIASALKACADGTPSGAYSCDTGASRVLCTNGLFGPSLSCNGQTCSSGVCGGTGNQCPTGSTAIIGGVDAGECRCTVSGLVVPKGGTCSTPVSPLPSAGVCQGALATCDDSVNKCCDGFVCQGADGNRKCQQQTLNQCGTGFVCGGAGGWLGFKCNSLSNGQCLENAQTFDTQQAARSYAGGCGQVDQVCVGGAQNRNLCGAFQVISDSCSGTGGRPEPSPEAPGSSPVPSPTPGVSPSPVASPTPGVSPSPEVSPSPSPLVCGSACSTTSECPQDTTCNNGLCQLTTCVNGTACSTDLCRITSCGSACTTSAECGTDMACDNSVCKLNACLNGSSCSSDSCRITACGSSCSANSDCPSDYSCDGSVCKLTTCVNGSSCDSAQCNVTTPSPVPSPVLGCNDTCVNNSDCKSSNQICVDTASGRRCRLETNITSDSCSAPGQTVAQATPQPQQPTSLPVAGSADVLKALGIGVLAIVLGIVGFLAL